jgi:hypothetical protein
MSLKRTLVIFAALVKMGGKQTFAANGTNVSSADNADVCRECPTFRFRPTADL